ncbi:N-acetylglucosamine/diacetylchitobiose ABC transporter substrate-binding protein [Kribbella deserti]|uniref:N-acetylglucosamine/diacetylchitobiose ABC transporter substrate-binding protein n=1 Tax=Kribbella deserti TaxID=1926257 RepID=A0ABV6QQS6_9ACTN
MSAQQPFTGRPVERRTLLRLALAGPVAGLTAAGCAKPAGDAAGAPTTAISATVRGDAPLEFFNFDGGFGKEWTNLPLDLYRQKYPQAAVKLTSGQQLPQQLQPRFVQGNPPDLIENVGLDTASLVGQNQVLELESLLGAPAWDTPGKTVAATLLPGAADAGRYDGKKFAMPYTYNLSGIWYSKPLLDKHGWQYPKTWDEMIALCARIKAAGLAPWTYQGKFPGYLTVPLLMSALKAAGPQVAVAVDNLEPNAWRHEALVEAATRYHEVAAKGYLLDGTTGLSHTQAQTYWAQGKAVFIPCGSWLENELGAVVPKDFGMTAAPAQGLSAADKLPFEAISGGPGGELLVAAKAKNPQGALELLRIILSKQSMQNFTRLTKSLTVVSGAADGLDLSPALTSMRQVINAAGSHVYPDWSFRTWYKKLLKASDDATGALMARELTPQQWSKRMQDAADRTAKDASVKKFSR